MENLLLKIIDIINANWCWIGTVSLIAALALAFSEIYKLISEELKEFFG